MRKAPFTDDAEGGRRKATLRALTRCKVACAAKDKIDHERLEPLVAGHRREET